MWSFLIIGYAATVLLELPILLVGLSPIHSRMRKLAATLWLNACSYPVVVLVLPQFLDPLTHRPRYLVVAEIFAPLCECAVFHAAFHRGTPRSVVIRDLCAITAANLWSFVVGELIYHFWARTHA